MGGNLDKLQEHIDLTKVGIEKTFKEPEITFNRYLNMKCA